MLELRIKHGRRQLAPHDLRSILGTKRAYQEIGDQIDFMIALLDEMAGDPDVELNGDETDSSHAEDDFCNHSEVMRYPGCPISDPDCCITDQPHDVAEEGDWERDDHYESEFSDPEALADQCRRIRQTRCVPHYVQWRERGAIMQRLLRHQLWTTPTTPTQRQIFRRKRGMPKRPRA